MGRYVHPYIPLTWALMVENACRENLQLAEEERRARSPIVGAGVTGSPLQLVDLDGFRAAVPENRKLFVPDDE